MSLSSWQPRLSGVSNTSVSWRGFKKRAPYFRYTQPFISPSPGSVRRHCGTRRCSGSLSDNSGRGENSASRKASPRDCSRDPGTQGMPQGLGESVPNQVLPHNDLSDIEEAITHGRSLHASTSRNDTFGPPYLFR